MTALLEYLNFAPVHRRVKRELKELEHMLYEETKAVQQHQQRAAYVQQRIQFLTNHYKDITP